MRIAARPWLKRIRLPKKFVQRIGRYALYLLYNSKTKIEYPPQKIPQSPVGTASAIRHCSSAPSALKGDCCIMANHCVAIGIRLRSRTPVRSLQPSPSAPCASSILQSQNKIASNLETLLLFATGSSCASQWCVMTGKLKCAEGALRAAAILGHRGGSSEQTPLLLDAQEGGGGGLPLLV